MSFWRRTLPEVPTIAHARECQNGPLMRSKNVVLAGPFYAPEQGPPERGLCSVGIRNLCAFPDEASSRDVSRSEVCPRLAKELLAKDGIAHHA